MSKRKPKIVVNGFGRIGRLLLRTWYEYYKNDIDLIAINGGGKKLEDMAHFIRHDSNYGRFGGELSVDNVSRDLFVDKVPISIVDNRDPEKLPWRDLDVDIVIEATGKFRDKEGCEKHLKAGAKKVLITAPSTSDDIKMFVLGFNEDKYNASKDIISSMASCTSNAIAPTLLAIHEKFNLLGYGMCTTHAYTHDQALVDAKHKDLRRARAAGQNMIPTSTGAAKALGKMDPRFKNSSVTLCLRVPTPTVSFAYLTLVIETPYGNATPDIVNDCITETITKKYISRYLGVESEELVSKDFEGDPRSGIVDLGLTQSIPIISSKASNLTLLQLGIWYDNEWGYAVRIMDFIDHMIKKNNF